MLDEVNKRRTITNTIIKRKRNKLDICQDTIAIHRHHHGRDNKRQRKQEKDRINPFYKESSYGWVSSHIKKQVTDRNGYNDKAWPLGANNDDESFL